MIAMLTNSNVFLATVLLEAQLKATDTDILTDYIILTYLILLLYLSFSLFPLLFPK
jgi:hypothetical protein